MKRIGTIRMATLAGLIGLALMAGCSVSNGTVRLDPSKMNANKKQKEQEAETEGEAGGERSGKSRRSNRQFSSWKECYERGYFEAERRLKKLSDRDWYYLRNYTITDKFLRILDEAEEFYATGQQCEEAMAQKEERPHESSQVGKMVYMTRDDAKALIEKAHSLIEEARGLYTQIEGMSKEERKAYLALDEEYFPKYDEHMETVKQMTRRIEPMLDYGGDGWKKQYLVFPQTIPTALKLEEMIPEIRKHYQDVFALQRFTFYGKNGYAETTWGRAFELNKALNLAEARLEKYKRHNKFAETKKSCRAERSTMPDKLEGMIEEADENDEPRQLRVYKHDSATQRHYTDISREFARANYCIEFLEGIGDEPTEYAAEIDRLRTKAEERRKAIRERMVAEAEPPEDVYEGDRGASTRSLIRREIVDHPDFPEGGEVTRVYLQRKNWERSKGRRWNKVNNAFEDYDYSHMTADVAVDIGGGRTAIYGVSIWQYHIDGEDSLEIHRKIYEMLTKNL